MAIRKSDLMTVDKSAGIFGMRRGLKIAAWVLGLCAAVALIAHGFSGRLKNWVRQEAIATLNARFAGQVTMKQFNVSLYPVIRISGQGLTLRLAGYPNFPPLITVARFSADAGLFELIRRPSHLHNLSLEGLEIHMPPRNVHPATTAPAAARKRINPLPVIADAMLIRNARLELLSSRADKPPRLFVISRLVMRQTGLGQPTLYHAWVTNPKPPGEIDCTGTFGPWNAEEPRKTPLTGTYTFTRADLSVFRGIAGILSSKGSFRGVVDEINVQGVTDTPDFSVRLSGNVAPLTTEFHSTVDGTTGNTMLEPVVARFLHSSLTARGGIFKVAQQKGRTVNLQITSKQARLQDLLRFAMKGLHPPLQGVANLNARMEIPPGSGDIAERMRLNGQFQIASARFTAPALNQKIQALNRRGLGKGQKEDIDDALSNLEADFVLRNAVLTFSNITFTVPGAAIRLIGTYELQDQALNFQGTLRLKARISQIVKGKRSLLLIPLNPFFRRGESGTVLPIKVSGTAENPTFKLQVGRLLRHDYN